VLDSTLNQTYPQIEVIVDYSSMYRYCEIIASYGGDHIYQIGQGKVLKSGS